MIAVNGRILSDPLTGVQRYLRELQGRIPNTGLLEPARPLHGLPGHIWEQTVLPKRVGKQLLWSPSNTGPLALRHQVVTIHDTAFFDFPGAQSALFQTWYRVLVPKLAKRCQAIITVSEFSKSRIVRWTGVDPDKVRVVPNGFDAHKFVGPQPNSHASRTILTVGTLEPRKNLGTLIQAWEIASRKLPEHRLVIVGGAGKRTVAHETLPTAGNVVFAGRLSDDELATAYRQADLAVFPSMYEGFGLPVLEAMASGCPVLCNDLPVFREVGGQAPRYVPASPHNLAQAIVDLIRDEGQRLKMRKAGTEQSQKFSWDRSASETRAVLNEFTD